MYHPNNSCAFLRAVTPALARLYREVRLGENQHSRVRQIGEPNPAARFTADTAARTGQSERAVQRDGARGAKIADDVKEAIVGTDLDKGWYLDQLKKADEHEQRRRVQEDLKKSTPSRDAPTVDPIDAAYGRLMSAWKAAPEVARCRFLKAVQ